jgi:hypothetical protein
MPSSNGLEAKPSGQVERYAAGCDFEVVEVYADDGVSGTIRCEYCMPDEDNLSLYVCRDPRLSLRELWPQVKHYD